MRRSALALLFLLAAELSAGQVPSSAVISRESATWLAWASAGCEKMPSCIVKGQLDQERWVFIVTFVERHDAEGTPIMGRSVSIILDSVGHVVYKGWVDGKELP